MAAGKPTLLAEVVAVLFALGILVGCGNEPDGDALAAALVARHGLDEVQAQCVVEEMRVSFSSDAIQAVERDGMVGLPRNSWQEYVWLFSACAIGAQASTGS